MRQGKVRYIGCSNFKAWLLATALSIADEHELVANGLCTAPLNILFRRIENELLPLCHHNGIGVIAYNPARRSVPDWQIPGSTQPPRETRFGFLSGHTQSVYPG